MATCLEAPKARRGTSNSNARGSSEDRRRRRQWLLKTYRANVDVALIEFNPLIGDHYEVPVGEGIPACRCFHCGGLLWEGTITVDRIIPGIHGGTYRRNNIRPACAKHNSELGAKLAHQRRKAKR